MKTYSFWWIMTDCPPERWLQTILLPSGMLEYIPVSLQTRDIPWHLSLSKISQTKSIDIVYFFITAKIHLHLSFVFLLIWIACLYPLPILLNCYFFKNFICLIFIYWFIRVIFISYLAKAFIIGKLMYENSNSHVFCTLHFKEKKNA